MKNFINKNEQNNTNSIVSINIVLKCLQQIVEQVFEQIFIKQTHHKLPSFILGKLQDSIEQVKQLQIHVDKGCKYKQKINQVQDIQSILVDNRSPNQCKQYFIKKPNSKKQKQNSKRLKALSSRSFNTLLQSQISTIRVQSPYKTKISKPFVKINHTQRQTLFEEDEKQQNWREQLKIKRQIVEHQKLLSELNQKKLVNHMKKVQQNLNNLKSYTFNYDSTLLISKPKIFESLNASQSIEENKQNQVVEKDKFRYEDISQLRSNIKKSIKVNKKLSNYNRQMSNPFIVNKNQSKQQNLKILKNRSYKSEILISQNRTQNLVQSFTNHNTIQKGIRIRQKGENNQGTEKDNVKVSKSLIDLTKSQFQKQYSRKKFVLKILKPKNQIKIKTQASLKTT